MLLPLLSPSIGLVTRGLEPAFTTNAKLTENREVCKISFNFCFSLRDLHYGTPWGNYIIIIIIIIFFFFTLGILIPEG